MRIILAAGGSGGHIFPAVALAGELEKKGVKNIFFVSSQRRLDRALFAACRYPCFFLSVNPMPRKFNIYRLLVFMLKFFIDTAGSICIVARTRPEVCVGFGGYSSAAIVIAAKMFRVPVILHEQNVFPGKANKILSRFADAIAVSFKESFTFFSRAAKERVVFSGNPLRLEMLTNDRIQSARKLGVSPDVKTVLIMGGSQGCSFLNNTAGRAARLISETPRRAADVQFIHLTGKKDYEQIKQFYRDNKIPGKVFSFLESIADAYCVSDLAITRSGASAIFELAFYSKAMILVPYPNHRNSQKSNAEYFEKAGAAICREEKNFSSEDLARDVLKLLQPGSNLREMELASGRQSVPDAGKKLAEEVVALVRRRKGAGTVPSRKW